MDYIETETVPRNVAVLNSIVPERSIVYCELAKSNQHFVDAAESAKTEENLTPLLQKIVASGFISNKVNPADILEAVDDFAALPIKDKKRFLMELLDKNMLYVNLCDLDDEEYAVSEADKAFTRSFYGLEDQ
jgi:adenine-specific DNA-methyltransferase